MIEGSGRDRRKHPRVPYGAWVEQMSEDSALRFFLAKNLSLGGMLLQADKSPPALGTKLRLRLVIENEKQTMTIAGEVIRHTQAVAGSQLFAVKFFDTTPEQDLFLTELIADLVSQGHAPDVE
jgi:c-di-GMP-binding flagellar brake protein YcgR